MSSITLFGAGSWGTGLAKHLAESGRDVTLWARRSEMAEQIRDTHRNPEHLNSLSLPSSVQVTADLEAAAAAADMWGIAVPSPHLREVAEQIQGHTRDDVTVVSLSKGIEKDTLMRMTQVLDDVFEDVPSEQIGTLYGPSHAEEVGEGRPTTVVAAASEERRADQIREAFQTDQLHVYVSTDLIGVEVGGSAKNALAIAAGISDGVGYGDNVKAALVTRGFAEIRRLGVAMGARSETFSGLTGIGDLIVTCTSEHSRNRYFGERIGQGRTLRVVQHEVGEVTEGIHTAQAVYELSEKYELEMPVSQAVYTVLFENGKPQKTVRALMTQPARRESWLSDALTAPPAR